MTLEELEARPEERTCAECGAECATKYAMGVAWCVDCFPAAAGEWEGT